MDKQHGLPWWAPALIGDHTVHSYKFVIIFGRKVTRL